MGVGQKQPSYNNAGSNERRTVDRGRRAIRYEERNRERINKEIVSDCTRLMKLRKRRGRAERNGRQGENNCTKEKEYQ